MNIEKSIELLKEFKKTGFHTLMIKYNEDRIHTNKLIEGAIETLLTAYEKEKEKNESLIKERATEIVYVDKNFVRKDKIKPIQIIDLDGKIHNVHKIEEE